MSEPTSRPSLAHHKSYSPLYSTTASPTQARVQMCSSTRLDPSFHDMSSLSRRGAPSDPPSRAERISVSPPPRLSSRQMDGFVKQDFSEAPRGSWSPELDAMPRLGHTGVSDPQNISPQSLVAPSLKEASHPRQTHAPSPPLFISYPPAPPAGIEPARNEALQSLWHTSFARLGHVMQVPFREDQRHNLWLTMSIVGRVLYGFGPVIIVQRFQTMGGPHEGGQANASNQSMPAGNTTGPSGLGGIPHPAYTPLGIAWPAALSVVGAGLGFAASIGNWNDGKKINRFVARRNWVLHNTGILLQLASHFITPLAVPQLQGSTRLVGYFPQAISAACLWNTIPASYSASASTRTQTLSDKAVARRMEACNWMRSLGGLFMSIWFGSYVVQMHPLAVETFNIVGVLGVLLSFTLLMIPLRVITSAPREVVEETQEQAQWRQFVAMGGLGFVGPMAHESTLTGAQMVSPTFQPACPPITEEFYFQPGPDEGGHPLTRVMTL